MRVRVRVSYRKVITSVCVWVRGCVWVCVRARRAIYAAAGEMCTSAVLQESNDGAGVGLRKV